MKNIISIVLGVFILSMVFSQVASAEFNDIENHDYAESINFLKEKNVLTGYDDGSTKPDSLINRAEFLKILMELKQISTGTEGHFNDVKSNDWFAPYVYGAIEAKLVNGYADGTFKPEQHINFSEASKMIFLAFEYKIEKKEDEEWYVPYMQVLSIKKAIPTSIDDFGEFITRGETAEMLWRMESVYKGKKYKTYGDFIKEKHMAEYAHSPGKFARSLVEKYGVEVNPEYSVDWVNDVWRTELEALAKYSALYDDNILFDMPCKNVYKNILNFTVPYRGSFFVKEFDKNTLKTVQNNEFEDENCARIFKDEHFIYVYNREDPNLFAAAYNVADPKTFKGLRNIETVYTDNENSYILMNGKLISIEVGDIDLKKLKGIPLSDKDEKPNLEDIHSCYGEGICINKIAKVEHYTLYRDENSIYFFDGKSISKQSEIDADTFEVVDFAKTSTENQAFLRDKNNVYRLTIDELEILDHLDSSSFEIIYSNDSKLLLQDDFKMHIELDGEIYLIDLSKYEKFETFVSNNENLSFTFYAHDDENVYRLLNRWQNGYEHGLKKSLIPVPLENMDADTFEVSIFDYSGHPMDSEFFVYGSSEGKFWFFDEENDVEVFNKEIDVETFEIIHDMIFSNGENSYNQGFIAKDKNNVLLYSNENFKFKNADGINANGFEQVMGQYPIFKNTTKVYFFNGTEFDEIEGADPETVKVEIVEASLYIKDKYKTWLYNKEDEKFVEVDE